jgi:hypothetical protein
VLTPVLDLLITTFNINHSYFSSPVTCPIQFTQFYSPFSRDIIFGSLGKAFDHKWQGIGYAHPHNTTDLQQAIHWACMAAQNDPHTITILISPDINWYQNSNPHTGPFPDTHVIAHFAEIQSRMRNPQYPPSPIPPGKNPLPCKYSVSITNTMTLVPMHK